MAALRKCFPGCTPKSCQAPAPKNKFSASLKSFFSSLLSLFSFFPEFADYFPEIVTLVLYAANLPTRRHAPGRGQLATSRRPPALSNSSSPTPNSPFVRRPKLLVLPPVGPRLGPSSDFYTPRGYILPLKSFVINKSISKSSTYFVDFCRFPVPKRPVFGVN